MPTVLVRKIILSAWLLILSHVLTSCQQYDDNNCGYGIECYAPTITSQPVDQTVTAGETAIFIVDVKWNQGHGRSQSLQWMKGTANISGATSRILELKNVQLSQDSTIYKCVATTAYGTETSKAALLHVVKAAGTAGIHSGTPE